MGLDWELMSPPRPGKKAAVRALRSKITKLDGKKLDQAIKKLGELEEDPFEFLQAPRIGVDVTATEWLRAKWRKREFGRVTWTALLKKHHGQVVVALAPQQDGVPLVGSYSGPLDFRGQQLKFAEELIGEKLVNEAWEHHTAEQMIDYAARLEAAVARSRKRNPKPSKKRRDLIAIVEAAARWLRFWGQLGFSYNAWF